MSNKVVVAVLALGTRGDVQPLLALALAFRDRGLDADQTLSLTLVTHSAHQSWVEEPARAGGLLLDWVAAPPARIWSSPAAGPAKRKAAQNVQHDEHSHMPCQQHIAASGESSLSGEDQLRRELLNACRAALCQPAASQLIMFNLFALEGFHIAEGLAVPCMAASPCLVPYAMPAAFERRFQAQQPLLYQRLTAADGEQRAVSCSQEGQQYPAQGGSLAWAHVRHWMWPLFSQERWGAWRQHGLGLPPVPYASCAHDAALPSPPLLLYGLSPLVIPRPGFWPASALLCGYWHSPRCFSTLQAELPTQIRQLLQPGKEQEGQAAGTVGGRGGAPICVDFGSMGRMGLLPQAHTTAAVLEAMGRALERHVILLTGGWETLLDACNRQQAVGTGWLCAVHQPISHDVLLPHCALLLSHGGAGTVGAALRCGVPQLVCPLHFDQQQWGERVVWLGCGAQLEPALLLRAGRPGSADRAALEQANGGEDEDAESSVRLQPGSQQDAQQDTPGQRYVRRAGAQRIQEAALKVASTVSALLHSAGVQRQCRELQQQLAAEDGLAAASEQVWHLLSGAARSALPQHA